MISRRFTIYRSIAAIQSSIVRRSMSQCPELAMTFYKDQEFSVQKVRDVICPTLRLAGEKSEQRGYDGFRRVFLHHVTGVRYDLED